MRRINEHEFVLSGETYRLTYYEKPVLTKFGIEQKIKPILRNYIEVNNFPIQLVNSNGNEEVTYTLARKILEYFSNNDSKKYKTENPKFEIQTHFKKKTTRNEVSKTPVSNEPANLNWDKISNKVTKKLLVIACSDAKIPGGEEVKTIDIFNNIETYPNLINCRNVRNVHYEGLFANNPAYFNKSRNGFRVNVNYFIQQVQQPLYLSAVKRYNGKFYKQGLRELYIEKNTDSNLHILIISGLYGVLEFRDTIIDYHLKIDNTNFWANRTCIHDAIKKYIEINDISNDMVFYSLSESYCSALKPLDIWTNLWQARVGYRNANSTISAEYLRNEFLPNL